MLMDLSNNPSQSKELQHVEIQKMVVDFLYVFLLIDFVPVFFPRKTRSFLWLRHDLKPRALCAKLHQALKNKLGNLLQI